MQPQGWPLLVEKGVGTLGERCSHHVGLTPGQVSRPATTGVPQGESSCRRVRLSAWL